MIDKIILVYIFLSVLCFIGMFILGYNLGREKYLVMILKRFFMSGYRDLTLQIQELRDLLEKKK